jgi:hypothetical protein
VYWTFFLYITNDLKKIDGWVDSRILGLEKLEVRKKIGEEASEEGCLPLPLWLWGN